ncbi:4590_t:CDS:1, partial [Paraglomus brasilianum]
ESEMEEIQSGSKENYLQNPDPWDSQEQLSIKRSANALRNLEESGRREKIKRRKRN